MKILWKNLGETPLECLTRYENRKKIFPHSTYAGRLDPMATGLLMALEGVEKNYKIKRTILNNTKIYEYSLLLGYSTDSYDYLGIVTQHKKSNFSLSDLQQAYIKIAHAKGMPYPKYSSRLLNKEACTQNQTSNSFIYRNKIQKIYTVSNRDIFKYIENTIQLVGGNFRQIDIIKCWDKALNSKNEKNNIMIDGLMECCSGTYVRSFANILEEYIKTPVVTAKIRRTHIGVYGIDDIIY